MQFDMHSRLRKPLQGDRKLAGGVTDLSVLGHDSQSIWVVRIAGLTFHPESVTMSEHVQHVLATTAIPIGVADTGHMKRGRH